MPRFLDHHTLEGPLPKEAVDMIKANVKSGKTDQFGVRPVEVLLAEGESFCVTEAPSADAVVRSHNAAGFAIGASNVKKVTSLASG